MESFLFQATIYLVTMVIAVPISSRLGLGSVLGYLLAGVVIGPVLGLAGAGLSDLQHFAEFGVVMMLFLIGLELDPRALWDMRHKLLGMGGLQVLATMLLITALAMAAGTGWRAGLAIGAMLSLSSTAIVLQTLTEKGLTQTAGGRSTFSVLLTQDIAVIPMLALLPLLAFPGARALAEAEASAEQIALPFLDSIPGWAAALTTFGAVGAVVLTGHYLIRPVFHWVHAARLREINTALALAIVIGIATLMNLVGLSPALGAFLGGVVLANSEFRHEIESDVAPFKGLLLGLFFITIGAGLNVELLFSKPVTLIGLTLLVMIAKGGVLFVLARSFGLGMRDKWLFTLGLAQAGEFGFVLDAFAARQRILTTALAQEILLIITLSMLLTPLFFILYERISLRSAKPAEDVPHDDIDENAPIIIAGIGRFGQVVNRMITMSGFATTVLDSSLSTIKTMRRFGYKSFYGDPTRPQILEAAGIKTARILIVCLDGPDDTVRLVEYARRLRPDLHIIARARDREHVFRLYQAGANDIVREMFDSSLRVARYALERSGLTEFEAAEAERVFYKLDRRAMRDLAEVWKPGVPGDQNPDYVALTHSLNRDLEEALQTAIAVAEVERETGRTTVRPGKFSQR